MTPGSYNEREAVELGWGLALSLQRVNNAPLSGVASELVEAWTNRGEKGAELSARFGFAQPMAREKSALFLKAVKRLQRTFGLNDDGYLGPSTWAAYCRDARTRLRGWPYLRVGGLPVEIACPAGVSLYHPPKDLFTHFRPNRADIKAMVLHWGGVDRASCIASLNDRKTSTQFLAEGNLEGGVLWVTQGLDLARIGYHAGEWNGASLGFDICRSPLLRYRARYPHAPVQKNTTGRGESECTGLEPEYADRLRDAIWAIAKAVGIPAHRSPGTAEFTPEQYTTFAREGGVVGHCNVTTPQERWDPAPWMAQLYPP